MTRAHCSFAHRSVVLLRVKRGHLSKVQGGSKEGQLQRASAALRVPAGPGVSPGVGLAPGGAR